MKIKKLLLILVFLSSNTNLFSLPQNPQVIEGAAETFLNDNHLTIVAKDRSIIHWDDFSIAQAETAQFQLPSSHAAVLNRVVEANPSRLLGQLQCNGALYLINPHGILIGKEGLIQAASFLASTLDISNHDFLEGKQLHFQGESLATIDNEGQIQALAGDVILLAQMLKNGGQIDALQGTIALGAGREVLYLPYGDERIQICLSSVKEKISEDPGINQIGSLHGGRVELKADGNLYGYAIKNEGIIEATEVENRGGQIYLVAEQGHTNHSGSLKGAEVRVLGQYVTLIDEAKIDVSGPAGGGVVLIGGDYQGQNPEILNAEFTLVEKGASIRADALEKGNGGKVIVWGNEVTGFYGTISAQGGEVGGDGGFVEVSGKDLDYRGMTNTLAPQGKNGLLYLDPTNITISDAATDAGITFGGACGATIYCNTGVLSPRNIQYGPVGTAGTILANLALGNVTVASTPGGPAGGSGDITFSATAVSGDWTGVNTNTFTLNARRHITFTTSFTNSTSAGNFTCMSGLGVLGTITVDAATTLSHSSAGTLTLDANTTAGSDITINGILDVTGGNLTVILLDDFTLAASPAALTFSSPGNTFSFTTTAAAGSVANFNGPVTINGNSLWTTTGALTFNDGLTTSGSGTMTVTSTGSFTTGAASVVNYNSTGDLTVNVSGAANDVTIGGSFSVPSANVTFSPFDDFTLTATTGVFNYSAAGKTLTLSAGSATTVNINGTLNVTGGNLNMNSFDNLVITALTGSILYDVTGGTCTFNATGGAAPSFNINGDLTINHGALTANASQNIAVGANGTIHYNSSDTANFTTTNGNFTLTGDMFVTDGNINITSDNNFSSGGGSSLIWSSPGTLNIMTSTAGITVGGIMTVSNGNVILDSNTTLSLGGGSTLTWSSPGSLTMLNHVPLITSTTTVNGLTNFTSGSWSINSQGSVSTGGGSATNYSAPSAFPILSHVGNITINGPVNLDTAALFSLTASIGTVAINDVVTNVSSGPITATSGGDFTVNATDAVMPSTIGSASGLTTINVGGSLTLNSSESTAGSNARIGFASGSSQADIIIDVAENCTMVARGDQNATIQSSRELTMTVGGGLSMASSLSEGQLGQATISASGNLSITAEDIILTGTAGAAVTSITTSQGNMKLIAMDSMSIVDHCLIGNQGSGNLTIVVDEQAPLPPQIGPGAFRLLGNAMITTSGGELSIFTATPSQNQVHGLINGATLAQGNQVLEVYFQLSGIDPPPFTIFYKIGGSSLIQLGIASSQLTQQGLDRAMGWAWTSPYVVCNDSIFSSKKSIYSNVCSSNREEMLFKRKPFEYPIFLPSVNCPDNPISPAAYDPFRYLFSLEQTDDIHDDRYQHL